MTSSAGGYPAWTDDTFWIVRGAGERTTQLCYELIARIVPEERITLIEERPFTKAIRKTLELGAASGQTWTVVIDADVLIDPPGWKQLLAAARQQPADVYCVQGMTVDKFIPILRPVGTGAYRSKLMPLGLPGIPEPGASLRPESTTVEYIFAQGYRRYRTPYRLGLHDTEQSYADILRKTFLHRAKHANVAAEMKDYWQTHRRADPDYRVALLGAAECERYDATIEVDRDFQRERFAEILRHEGLTEKPPLDLTAEHATRVRAAVAGFAPVENIQRRKFPEFDRFTYSDDAPPQPSLIHRAVGRLARMFR